MAAPAADSKQRDSSDGTAPKRSALKKERTHGQTQIRAAPTKGLTIAALVVALLAIISLALSPRIQRSVHSAKVSASPSTFWQHFLSGTGRGKSTQRLQWGSTDKMTDGRIHSERQSALAPIWFVAHGGPPTVFDKTHPAHQHWLRLAADIRSYDGSSTSARPLLRGIVFVSAHWQADPWSVAGSPMGVQLNTDAANPLLYDYYGFPREYYSLQLRTENPAWLSSLVGETLQRGGVPTFTTQRGIDHGVFIPLLAGFGERGEGLPPLVQASLPPAAKAGHEQDDGVRAMKLGRALRSLREQGIAVIGGGQPVHALRDLFTLPKGTMPPYTKPFTAALTAAVCPAGGEAGEVGDKGEMSNETSSPRQYAHVDEAEPARWTAAKALFQHPHYRGAHPTSEHLLPVLVALGAAYDHEAGVEEFKLDEGPMAWNMYKWGG